jgi:hypothetical protein
MRIEVRTPKEPKRVFRPWQPTIDLRGRHPRIYRGYRARQKEALQYNANV